MSGKAQGSSFRLEVLKARGNGVVTTIDDISGSTTIAELKKKVAQLKPNLYADRQSYRTEPTGKSVKDTQKLSELNVDKSGKIYFKDLGPQIGWSTVFMTEYAGPLLIYLIFYTRPSLIYGSSINAKPVHLAVHLGAACWTFHYAKRILETIFVHRFSHSTMPILNIFKNSGYYWGFTAFIAYFINHPKYTPPAFGAAQIYLGLAIFLLSELGNYSIHILLRDLRPAGSTERRIPYPSPSNPLTNLFSLVSCPNYTYEIGAWLGFSLMTQTFPALLFGIAGAAQMIVWAKQKHRAYKKEFADKYPKQRKAIIPFLI